MQQSPSGGNHSKAFTSRLHKYALIKKNILRYNNNSYMTKTPRKAIMFRSKLKNKHNKKRLTENWDNYKRSRNLLRNTKKNYFSNLNLKNISYKRNFHSALL